MHFYAPKNNASDHSQSYVRHCAFTCYIHKCFIIDQTILHSPLYTTIHWLQQTSYCIHNDKSTSYILHTSLTLMKIQQYINPFFTAIYIFGPTLSTASFCIINGIVLFLILQKLAVPRVCNSSHAYVLPY